MDLAGSRPAPYSEKHRQTVARREFEQSVSLMTARVRKDAKNGPLGDNAAQRGDSTLSLDPPTLIRG